MEKVFAVLKQRHVCEDKLLWLSSLPRGLFKKSKKLLWSINMDFNCMAGKKYSMHKDHEVKSKIELSRNITFCLSLHQGVIYSFPSRNNVSEGLIDPLL